MSGANNTPGSTSFSIAAKVKDYYQLIKFTLSFTVVFSSVVCYLLAPNVVDYNWLMILLLFIAGMLITGSANAINQAVEKDTDAMMKRTAARPVADGRMSRNEAYTFAVIAGLVGVWMIGWFFKADDDSFNWNAALLSAFSLFLYAFIYTPLKKVNSIAVLIGAFPGALPCLIGWVAATNMINPLGIITVNGKEFSNAGGWILFAIQFLWQFPHFWAIAWVAHGDYSKAGFKLLPADKGPTRFTAVQGIMYSVLMIPVGVLPYYFGLSGQASMWILVVANLFMVVQSIRLYIGMDVQSARRVMFSSYIYLPVVLLALLADKIR
ncbi:MAG: heme o synthase [Chitinophagaceae bacterium]|nr:heme o synthase [Chitinophagaceae bacterium]MDP1765211.1 heme o synthase [Sediminibacterium sp.]MDP1810528.1 heme o synthase [Sediminibacterium sp.]MDP3129599.1 heme o synthase [Sediminibacterium sp.]MDP3666317.1 heme o synthase [Sediminibacterium sp.]